MSVVYLVCVEDVPFFCIFSVFCVLYFLRCAFCVLCFNVVYVSTVM